MRERRRRRENRCPRCGSPSYTEITYGYPSPELVERSREEPRTVLGGCCIDSDSPRWQCLECGEQWGRIMSS